MGLKFLYYIDTSANWTLFTLGIICVPFGIGGMLLVTPVRNENVVAPWYHATGIWVGMTFLAVAMMMPFARFHPTFLRVAVVLTYLAMVVSAVGLGVGIDEFTNWFENPVVKTFGAYSEGYEAEIHQQNSAASVVQRFADFDLFHKTRVIVVMAGNLLGICMLLFRIVTLGLVIFDEFTTRGYDVFTPEEEMMYQAMTEREMAAEDGNEKQDYEAGYQPILYAGGKPGMTMGELPEEDEDEETRDDVLYQRRINAISRLETIPGGASKFYEYEEPVKEKRADYSKPLSTIIEVKGEKQGVAGMELDGAMELDGEIEIYGVTKPDDAMEVDAAKPSKLADERMDN